MRQMRGAARYEEFREQGSDRFDTANAVLDRYVGRVKPSAVPGGAGADKIGQPLRNLAVRIPSQCRLWMLEQSSKVSHRYGRFWIPPIAVMVEKPGSLLDTHLMTKGVLEPVLIAEIC